MEWKSFFETNLDIHGPEVYEYHCFLVKQGGFFGKGLDSRFWVVTNYFLYNTECVFDSKTGKIKFKEAKWSLPIKALSKIVMEVDKENSIQFNIESTKEGQNEAIQQYLSDAGRAKKCKFDKDYSKLKPKYEV